MWPETIETCVLAQLHRRGRLTRSELHELTGVRPNTIGEAVKDMIDKGLIREGELETLGPGRPRASLRIDDAPWRVVGLGLDARQVTVCRMTPRGDVTGRQVATSQGDPRGLVQQAANLLRQAMGPGVLAVGVSVPGFVDPQHRALLLRSASPGQRSLDLTDLYDTAGDVPLVLENDMHAVAARWTLARHADLDEDVLLVSLRDNAIGAAMLIEGKPNRGCVVGGNELGHLRFAVDTERCHCGHTGCLARIFSTAYLQKLGASATLPELAARYDGADGPLTTVLDHLATGLSNVINFVRPNRIVLISELTAHPVFERVLKDRTRDKLLPDIAPRVQFESWDQPLASTGVNAGWLALAALYSPDWRQAAAADPPRRRRRSPAPTQPAAVSA